MALPVIGASAETASVVEAASPAADEVNAAELAAVRNALAANDALSDSEKQKLQGLLAQAEAWLRDYESARAELENLKARIKNAPQRIEALRQQSASGSGEPVEIPDDASLGQLQLMISQAQARLDQAQNRLGEQQLTLSRLQVGAKGIGEKITQLSNQLSTLDTELRTRVGNEPELLSRARSLSLRIRKQLNQARLELAKLELGNLDVLTELATAEREALNNQIRQQRATIKALQRATQSRQAATARKEVQQAEEIQARSAHLPPLLQQIAADTAKLRLERARLIKKENALTNRLREIRQQAKDIEVDFSHSRDRVQAVGPTPAIGRMLKHRRAELPPLRAFEQSSRQRIKSIDQATERQLEIEDQLRALDDPHLAEQQLLSRLAGGQADVSDTALRQQAKTLLEEKKSALKALQSEYSQYIGQLVQLQVSEKQLVEQARAYVDFIDEQLIWIPNAGLKALLKPNAWLDMLAWFGAPESWRTAWQDLANLVRHHPARILLLLGLTWFLLVSRRHAQDQLSRIAHDTHRIRSDSFLLTLRAIWITLALAIPVPLLMIALSWGILIQPASAPFSRAIAGGFLNLGIALGVARLLLKICKKNGLGDSHLRWPQALRDSLSHEIRWLLPVSLPLVFAVGVSYAGNTPNVVQSVGQLAFIVLMLMLTIALIRFLRWESPTLRYLRSYKPGSRLVQLHFFWYPVVILIPVALGVTAALGYYFTAIQFGQRVRMTIWLFLGLALARDLLLRWFYIEERRLRLADAIKRRDEQRAAQMAKREDEPAGDSGADQPPEEPQVNYNQLSEQSRRLVWVIFLFSGLFGAWSIWIDLIPNLRFLNQITLPFIVERVVDGAPRELPITLADVTTGLLLILVTILAAKNLPGLLEIALLRRLPITSGARYAITTLSQYAIVGIGIFFAFSSIGVQWSNIQWLVAALGVGVGFGLQEIVANFISGIILLFEQPIRVGDVVTVNNTLGTVSRLRMRATVIVNRDQQELIVPNKAFITGEVLNWTLSDTLNRRIITVGIAYGSDIARAMKLMTEAARENPNVLKDPPPYTVFEEFGDSALILKLRMFIKINSMRDRRTITSEVSESIDHKLREAGITIAFPQLDVHLPDAKKDSRKG